MLLTNCFSFHPQGKCFLLSEAVILFPEVCKSVCAKFHLRQVCHNLANTNSGNASINHAFSNRYTCQTQHKDPFASFPFAQKKLLSSPLLSLHPSFDPTCPLLQAPSWLKIMLILNSSFSERLLNKNTKLFLIISVPFSAWQCRCGVRALFPHFLLQQIKAWRNHYFGNIIASPIQSILINMRTG